MWIFAIGIEDPLMMPMDRLQHSHPRKDHRPVVLCRARDAVGRGLQRRDRRRAAAPSERISSQMMASKKEAAN